MKTFLAIALATLATLAHAGDCRSPKIIGIDYHTARAMLIKAGCRPIAYDPNSAEHGGRPAPDDAAELGYIESEHSGQGIGSRWFHWKGFSVYMTACEFNDPRTKCIVKSVRLSH